MSGIDNFDRIIRFDKTDLLSDTNQLEISLTNRFYVKRKDDRVEEVLSWQLTQVRYFDPTFGGAVVQGQRNVVEAVTELTAYTFLDGPRNYSPVISAPSGAARPAPRRLNGAPITIRCAATL